VDDSEDARLLLRLGLDDCKGIEVIGEAVNGLAGVEAIRDLQPDVVIMDLRMPLMDGVEATRLAKGASPDSKIVGYTSEPEANELMIEAGATKCFNKAESEELFAYLGC
jgi:DNA-binding NarL/FixJ family response regulator